METLEEEERKSPLRIILSLIFFIVVVGLLVFYWFVPRGDIEFFSENRNYNFSISGNVDMQFYENMRFPSKDISYRIESCNLKRQNDMKEGFGIVQNLTILNFYEVPSNEEIYITCEEEQRFEGGMFIAGEGGPTNITKTENFNVILSGRILLIRDSDCPSPNVAVHELFHVLGFKHSENKNNIMYNFSSCSQTIGEDIPNFINEVYSYPSQADLSLENVYAKMNGKYLDVNFSVWNYGLKNSESTTIKILSGEKVLKEIEVKEIEIGYGISYSLENIFVTKIIVNELEMVIEENQEELNFENNKIKLKINDA